MAKKEIIGLTYEGDRLRLARIRTTKAGVELLEVDTIHLPQPILSKREVGADQQDFSNEYDEIFETESSSTSELSDLYDLENFGLDEEGPASADGSELENNFDMTRADDDAETAADNEQMLAQYVGKYSSSKLRIGLHIPFGKTTFQFFKNVDPSKMKKKDRIEFFEEKLRPIFGRDVIEEHYSWIKVGENDCLLAYNPNDFELLNLVELAETYSKKKLLVMDRQPDEGIWAGLVRSNYELKPDEITGLIAIGDKNSRVMFMKGGEIISVLPIISEGEDDESILNTIFSKILFEIDKGEIPKITRILLIRSAKLSEKAKKHFQKQFEDVEVDFFTLHNEKVSYADEILNSPNYLQPYNTAIGAAWAASDSDSKAFTGFTLLPEYVLEKQRVLKIEWHGIAILILIALTPLFINNFYFEKAAELNQLEQEISSLNAQIDELTPIATMTEDLIADFQVINAENNRLLDLAEYSQKWSEVMRILNEGVYEIPNIWLTTLRTNDNNINLTGISLTREQIPVLATLFTDANINQVSETEIRGQQVYSFSMQANNFRQDIDEFLLDLPEYDFESELNGAEFPVDFSMDAEVQPSPGVQTESIQPDQAEAALPSESEPEPAPTVDVEEVEARVDLAQQEEAAAVIEEEISAEDEETVQEELTQNSSEPASALDRGNTNFSPYGLTGTEDELLYGAYTIVLHSIPSGTRARWERSRLADEGYKTTLWQATLEDGTLTWRIGVGQFETVDDALAAISDLPEPYHSNHFIIRIR